MLRAFSLLRNAAILAGCFPAYRFCESWGWTDAYWVIGIVAFFSLLGIHGDLKPSPRRAPETKEGRCEGCCRCGRR